MKMDAHILGGPRLAQGGGGGVEGEDTLRCI